MDTRGAFALVLLCPFLVSARAWAEDTAEGWHSREAARETIAFEMDGAASVPPAQWGNQARDWAISDKRSLFDLVPRLRETCALYVMDPAICQTDITVRFVGPQVFQNVLRQSSYLDSFVVTSYRDLEDINPEMGQLVATERTTVRTFFEDHFGTPPVVFIANRNTPASIHLEILVAHELGHLIYESGPSEAKWDKGSNIKAGYRGPNPPIIDDNFVEKWFGEEKARQTVLLKTYEKGPLRGKLYALKDKFGTYMEDFAHLNEMRVVRRYHPQMDFKSYQCARISVQPDAEQQIRNLTNSTMTCEEQMQWQPLMMQEYRKILWDIVSNDRLG